MALIHFHHFLFDSDRGTLTCELDGVSTEVVLRNKVALLLSYFLQNANRVVSKDELLEKLWQNGEYRENSLTQSIRELRKALGDNAQHPTYIKTFPQRGYQWLCEASIKETSKRTEQSANQPFAMRSLLKWSAAVIIFTVISLLAFVDVISDNDSTLTNRQNNELTTLIVLPIENRTQDPAMAWLELGLADMIATRLRLLGGIDVIPPAESSVMAISAGENWPTDTEGVVNILTSADAQVALYASVRFHGKLQVYDFQLIYSDGSTAQGSITYESLPASVQPIATQLKHLLVPQDSKVESLPPTSQAKEPIAAQAAAEGLQLLQTSGPEKAAQYFEAALKIEPTYGWANAHLFRAYVLMADWQKASKLFASLPLRAVEQDHLLNAYLQYWQAEMSLRLGRSDIGKAIDEAVEKAELALDNHLLVSAYRLKSLYAWQQMKWQEHSYWQKKAKHSSPLQKELGASAEELFYLGSPANEGLEKSPTNDLLANQAKLTSALNFFEQLNNKPMIAASKLAIAKNYTFSLDVREQAVKDAIALFSELNQPYEHAKSLLYIGFFNMQLHQGKAAQIFFQQAATVIDKFKLESLKELVTFYLAFANLDQGLDQSFSGRHLQNPVKLNTAIEQLNDYLSQASDPYLMAGAYVFLGWAHTGLGEYQTAENNFIKAKALSAEHDLIGVGGYAIHSYMRLLLELNRYQEIVELAHEPVTSKLQLLYLSRAYYELGEIDHAVAKMEQIKSEFIAAWQQQDEQRLNQYKLAKQGKILVLNSEPEAHVYYCESDWNMTSF